MTTHAKRFEYAISLDRDGTMLADGEAPLTPGEEWTPEHLLLGALARCTLTSLRFHAKRQGVAVVASGEATGAVTLREEEGRFGLVEARARFEIELTPLPQEEALDKLIARAEHDCFVGASIRPTTAYEWVVNGKPYTRPD